MKKYILSLLTLFSCASYGFDKQYYAQKVGGEVLTMLGVIGIVGTYFFTGTRPGLECLRSYAKSRGTYFKKGDPIVTTDLKYTLYALGLALCATGLYIKQ